MGNSDSHQDSNIIILGIETTCDETACAVVENGKRVISSVVSSQVELHAPYGGVVPEIASRAHLEMINPVISRAIDHARTVLQSRQDNSSEFHIDAIAVANTPGLIGSLLVGLMAAKTLAWVWDIPLIGVNHLHAHAYAPALDAEPIDYPAVALVASGGHTSLYLCRSCLDIELLGATIDDAAGEAFDKVSAILGLGYPGGPAIERAARQGRADKIRFPRTFLDENSLDFSFSGIKTAVLYYVNGTPGAIRSGVSKGIENLTEQDKADIAACFQAAMVEMMVVKLRRAALAYKTKTLIIGGGVSANSALREEVRKLGEEIGAKVRLPALQYAGDNAAMIAGMGYHYLQAGKIDDLQLDAVPTTRQ